MNGTWKDRVSGSKIVAKITTKVEDDPLITCSPVYCYRGFWPFTKRYKCNEICTYKPRTKTLYTLDLDFEAEGITGFKADIKFSGKVKAYKVHSTGWIEFRFPGLRKHEANSVTRGGVGKRYL